jgi:uncharacterized membrane protein YccC
MIGQLLKIPLVPRFYPNHLGPSLQATLSTLADLDLQFDCKLEKLLESPHSEDVRDQLVQDLHDRHGQEREPLVKRLAELNAQTRSCLGLRA